MVTTPECSVSGDAAIEAAVLAATKGTMLLVTAVLAFGVRDVSSAFNESANLSWGVWSSLLSMAIIFPLMMLTGGLASDVGVFLLILVTLWVSAGTLLFAFGHKFFTLITEERSIAASQMRCSKQSAGSLSGTRSGGTGTGTGTGGTGTGNASASVFNLPSLDMCSLSLLEKYICALESQLHMARARRIKEYGAFSQAGTNSSIGGPGPGTGGAGGSTGGATGIGNHKGLHTRSRSGAGGRGAADDLPLLALLETQVLEDDAAKLKQQKQQQQQQHPKQQHPAAQFQAQVAAALVARHTLSKQLSATGASSSTRASLSPQPSPMAETRAPSPSPLPHDQTVTRAPSPLLTLALPPSSPLSIRSASPNTTQRKLLQLAHPTLQPPPAAPVSHHQHHQPSQLTQQSQPTPTPTSPQLSLQSPSHLQHPPPSTSSASPRNRAPLRISRGASPIPPGPTGMGMASLGAGASGGGFQPLGIPSPSQRRPSVPLAHAQSSRGSAGSGAASPIPRAALMILTQQQPQHK